MARRQDPADRRGPARLGYKSGLVALNKLSNVFDACPKQRDRLNEGTMACTFVRLALMAMIINCATAANSEELSGIAAQKLLTGHWVGEGSNAKGPYVFHAINCVNGRFAVAVERSEENTLIYFGHWRTDGATMTHVSEKSGLFDPESLDLLSMDVDRFSNRYHIVEITESLMIYEWRGESTRRFEAERSAEISGGWNEKLNQLACDIQPSLS